MCLDEYIFMDDCGKVEACAYDNGIRIMRRTAYQKYEIFIGWCIFREIVKAVRRDGYINV